MAISETQKVDYLWKKLAYGLSKTDTNANKRATNESIASPLLIRGSNVWAQSDLIPGVMPGSSSGVVTVYPTSSPDETTADTSATLNRTWKTGLIDWISPEFGSTYLVKVYIHTAGDAGNAAASGIQVFGAGSGNNDEWFFDYQSGILHFIGTNLPAGISGKSIYVSGARYTGIKGVAVPGGAASFTALNITGISTFSGNVEISSLTNNRIAIVGSGSTIEDDANLTFDGSTLAVGVDLDVDGLTDLDELKVAGVSTFSGEVGFTTHVDINDHSRLRIGDDQDLEIFHQGSNSIVQNSTGELQLRGNTIRLLNAATTKDYAFFNNDGSVDLYYDNSIKFQTTGIGVSVSNGVGLTATIAGPSNLILDPGVVGDNTGIVRIKGDLFVDGTQTQINSTTIELADFIVGVATTATSDLLSDGAGIQIGPNNTFLYEFNSGTNPSLKSSENLNVASGKVYQIDQTERLSADTLSLGTGTTIHSPDSNALTFGTNSTEKVRITSDGDVGIGSVIPAGKLDVVGHTELDSVNVSGLSTFASDLDINASVDIDGRTELDITNISETLNVVGVSTFASNVDLNADLDVDGRTELDITNISETLNVTGVSTFAGNIDANGDLDVDGHTELDHVNVSAASTFGGLVDINAGAQANTLKVEDLTDNRIVLAGTGGELEDSANLTFDGTTLALTGNQTVSGTIDIDGQAIFDDITVSAASTFTGNIDANGDLDVDGQTDLDVLNVAELATFSANIDANGDLDVDGRTELDITNISDTLNVVGVATFANNIDANGDLDVDGRTELDITNISQTLNVVGVATFANNIDANGDLDVDGRTELDITNISETLNVTGIATFENNVNVGGALSVTGNSYFVGVVTFSAGTDGNIVLGATATDNVVFNADVNSNIIPNTNNTYDLGSSSQEWKDLYLNGIAYIDTLQVHEGSTFTGNIDANGDLDVDGRTELDITNISETLNVVGVSTFAANADFNGSIDVDGHTELDDVNVSGASTFGGLVDINAGAQVNTLKVEDLTDNRVVLAGTGGELEDSGNLTFNGTLLALTGNQTISGTIDVDGQAIFDDITVSAASTFAGLVDINAGAQANTFKVEDLTSGRVVLAGTGGELEDSGNLTFNGTLLALTGNQTVSGTINVDGQAIFDDITVSAASTFTGHIDANGNLDVDGQTDLDILNVSDASTFSGLVDINAGGQANTFKVEDLTDNRVVIVGNGGELEDDANFTFDGTRLALDVGLTVTGVSTFAGNIDANGDLDVDGHTELDNVNIAGFSTFAQLVDVNANLTISQDLTVEGSVGIASLIPSAKLDVVGLAKFDDVNVSGASTFTGNIDANGDLDVDGTTELDVLNVAETATFSSNIDANGDLDVDGHTELDDLNVTGIATFTNTINFNGNIDLDADLDVDGHTELDNVNISGVVTATAFHTGAEGSAIRVTSDTISGPAEIVIDPAAVGDNTGVLRIKGDLFVDGTQTQINSTTIELADFIVGVATTATTNILADGAGIGIGTDKFFTFDHTNTAFKSTENLNLETGHTYKINGTDVLSSTTLGSNVVNSSLTGIGSLTELSVGGVSTFTGNIDANGDLDVDGHTELDNINISGVTTTSGLVDINAGGQANTFKVEDLSNNRVVIVGTGGELEDDANFTFDGTRLALGVGLTVTGVSTFANNIDANGDLDVDGHTDLDHVIVSLASTFSDRVIFDSTNSIQIPVGTEAQKDAVGTAVTGQIRFNTTNAQFEGFGVGNNWGSLGGVKDVDRDTFITAEASAGNDDDVLSFHTAGSIRAAIDSTGQVGIGSTIPAATLDVLGDTKLTGILTVTNGIDGIGIQSEGTSITTGIITTFNFVGSAISSITNTSGLVEIDLKAGTFTRSTTSFTATADQTTFSLTYTPNFIDVYHNGVRLTATEFTATNGTSVVLTEGAFAGDTIDIVAFQNSALFNTSKWSLVDTTDLQGDIFKDTNVGIGTAKPTDAAHSSNTKILNVGVVTANNFYGALTGNVTGTADLASGLTGTPDITVGTINATTVSVAGTITYDDVSNVDSVGLVTARTGVRVTEGGLIVTAGVSTFSANIDANGDLDVDGHTELDQLRVSGISTFTGNIDANGDLDVDGHTDLDNLIVTGVSTFSANIDADGDLDVDGHTDLDNLVVAGVSTFSAALDINAGVNISSDLTIADKIVHDSDTNTAIRFPTNDTVTIETAGTERLHIDANGKVGISTDSPAARVDLEGTLGLEATTTIISSTSATTIDTLPIATYRSAKFQIQVTQGTNYQTADLLVIHDGSIASSIEYASLSTSEELAVFTTTISGSNLLLQATMSYASSATVKVVRYGVTI